MAGFSWSSRSGPSPMSMSRSAIGRSRLWRIRTSLSRSATRWRSGSRRAGCGCSTLRARRGFEASETGRHEGVRMGEVRTIGPPVAAAELVLLVDALLPGDELFPAASTVGVQALLASRLQLLRGVSALGELTRAIADAGGPLGVLDEGGRHVAVAKVQRQYAALFDDVLRVTYLAYYESALVQDAI